MDDLLRTDDLLRKALSEFAASGSTVRAARLAEEYAPGMHRLEMTIEVKARTATVLDFDLWPLPGVETFDLRSETRMVVVLSNDGSGAVVASQGGDQYAYLRDEIGLTFEDMGLDPPGPGIWEFRGRLRLYEEDHEWKGEWSRLSRAALDAASRGEWKPSEKTIRDRVAEALAALQVVIGPPPDDGFRDLIGGGTLLSKARKVESILESLLKDVGGQL